MENIGLHYCSKFLKNLTVFWGVMAKKPLKISPKLYFLLFGKYLNIDNTGNTNAILMKFTPIMYLHVIFHVAQKWGLTQRGSFGVVKKH